MEKLYTLKEVADMWRLNLRTVQKWCAEGKLQAFRIGKQYRISEDAINEFKTKNLNTKAG